MPTHNHFEHSLQKPSVSAGLVFSQTGHSERLREGEHLGEVNAFLSKLEGKSIIILFSSKK